LRVSHFGNRDASSRQDATLRLTSDSVRLLRVKGSNGRRRRPKSLSPWTVRREAGFVRMDELPASTVVLDLLRYPAFLPLMRLTFVGH
jgi:hypothetical protein